MLDPNAPYATVRHVEDRQHRPGEFDPVARHREHCEFAAGKEGTDGGQNTPP